MEDDRTTEVPEGTPQDGDATADDWNYSNGYLAGLKGVTIPSTAPSFGDAGNRGRHNSNENTFDTSDPHLRDLLKLLDQQDAQNQAKEADQEASSEDDSNATAAAPATDDNRKEAKNTKQEPKKSAWKAAMDQTQMPVVPPANLQTPTFVVPDNKGKDDAVTKERIAKAQLVAQTCTPSIRMPILNSSTR
ncbi:hypothetical protein D805_0254 [Bifidobacterium thermophilum RBL67]|uniref:Uncharacterized protein n=1 Tax=Bifidobacterium thermophilum RBL67 TaxID=1254439 RepID=M4RAP0_9BIFI|nr:hypothetical protein [Bifidobacterium thermophilum]AGH40521.1 hypothetical protein D805_0254 [Bifidobacterium thermophilum RBL67]